MFQRVKWKKKKNSKLHLSTQIILMLFTSTKITHALLSSSQIILTLHLITQIKHAQHLHLTKVKLPTFIPGMKVMLLLGPLIIHTLRHIPSSHHDAQPLTSYQVHTYSQPNLSAQSGPGSPQQSSASAPKLVLFRNNNLAVKGYISCSYF